MAKSDPFRWLAPSPEVIRLVVMIGPFSETRLM